jgi:choline dehydrogenase
LWTVERAVLCASVWVAGVSSDRDGVVDDESRVQRMRVVDASVMPSMPSATTYLSTMMIAENASDMIWGRVALAPVEGVGA